ncbi:hypothetical protein Y032_0030g2014, partial [Ancylostoma ceylanicum]
LLEVWTGKGSIIDVFSLPEFGELECVREPLPPYGLLVMLSRRQELLPKTISVAVGTDDSEEAPNQSNLRSKSKKTKRSQTPKQDTGFRPPPLIRPNSSAVAISAGIHKQLDSDHISDFKTPTICKTEDPIVVCNTSKTAVYNGNEILTDGFPAKCSTQPADIAPQAEDLPNPLTFFEQTSGVKGVNSSEARRASQTTEVRCYMDTCEFSKVLRAIYTRCGLSDVNINLRKIFYEDLSTRHKILNEKNAQPSRGRKRVRLSCDCDATGPYSRSYRRMRSNIVPECSANCEEPRSSSVEKSELLSSCSVRCVDAASSLRNQVEPQRMCEQSPCSAANPFQCAPHENGDLRNSKTIGDEVLLPERVADSHISTTSVEGQHLPLKKHTRLDSAFCDEDEKDDHVPRNTVPVIAPVFHLPVKTAQASCAARSHKLVATNQITTVTTEAVENSDNLPQESSVLDCLVFPDTNDEVKRYLDFIRKAVAVHHLQRGVLPEMKDILKDLDEEVSAKWVDYVLMYIPEVSVMPYDGQVRAISIPLLIF